MLERINREIITARKNKDRLRTQALTLIKAELINNSKAKKVLDEGQVVQSYARRLEKASHAFKKTDKYDDLVKEMEVISEFIPKPISKEKVEKWVKAYFKTHPDASNPGLIIKHLKETFGSHNGHVIAPEVMRYMVTIKADVAVASVNKLEKKYNCKVT